MTDGLMRYALRRLMAVVCLAALLCVATSAPAAPVNGQNASNALGQYDIDNATVLYTKGGVNNGPNQLGFNTPHGIAMDPVNHRLFVTDNQNARILVYNLNSSNGFVTRVPSNVLGKLNFTGGACSATGCGFGNVGDLTFDSVNNRLFVDDSNSNSVKVFNTSTITNGMGASYVLGQANFTTTAAATTQSGLTTPSNLNFDSANEFLYVSDTGNSRVMVFNVAPGTIANGENASYVLGQSNFTTGTSATTQSGLYKPRELALDSTNDLLYVVDANNNRVMVFPTASTGGPLNGNGENASYELGQPSGGTAFTTATAGTTQSGMSAPVGVALDPTNYLLFVSETSNSRVTVWNVASGTIASGENASYVLGQGNFTSTGTYTTQSGFVQPREEFYDPGTSRLFVTDTVNNRVEIFNVAPGTIANGENASDGLGQFNTDNATVVYTKGGINNGPNQLGFNFSNVASGMALDSVHHRFFVVDSPNNRVLVYNLNTDNSFSTNVPANVIGQTSFISNTGGQSQSVVNGPVVVAYDSTNNRLFVADAFNHRVLVFNTSSITNGMNASYVLGEPNFTSSANYSLVNQSSLGQLGGLAYDSVDGWLFVGDGSNNRVMVFNVAPGTIANGENASYVLGQSSFTTSTGATTQSGMITPGGVAYDPVNARLFVSDITNRRVLVFNVASGTIANGENASYVLGQTNFTSSSAGTTQSSFAIGMGGVSYDPTNSRLFAGDLGNNRVLVFNVSPGTIANGENASAVLGQSTFTTATAATTQSGLSGPSQVLYDPGSGQLFVNDQSNNRIMIFNASALSTNTQGFGIGGYN